MKISTEHIVGRYYNNGSYKILELVKVLELKQETVNDTLRYILVKEGKSTSYEEISIEEFKLLKKNPLS